MRKACREWSIRIHDTGFLPEAEMVRRAGGGTCYEMVRDKSKYDQERIMAAADLANQRDPKALGELTKLLKDKDSAVRYWGAIGCLSLGADAKPAAQDLTAALTDAAPNVRIAVAEALCNLGQCDKALPVLAKELGGTDQWAALHAANAIDRLDEKARPVLDAMKKATRGGRYVARAMQKAVADLQK